MASEVSICNQALGWLGANLITSFDDETTEANLCQANYADIRNAVLEELDWSFARTRRIFNSPESTEPAFGFSFAHVMPVDCLRVISAVQNDSVSAVENAGNNMEWEYEDRRVLCDQEVIYVKYTRLVVAVQRFSPMFIQALAQRIAADLAIPLTRDKALQQQHWQLYLLKVSQGGTVDGMQGRAQQRYASGLKRVR